MATSALLDILGDDDDYETDAQPFSPAKSPETGSVDEDFIENSTKSSEATGEFKVENSSVEISNSKGVRIGHSITQKTDITFEKAGSVVVDRRQFNYITYPDSNNKAPPVRSNSQISIVSKVQEFNRDRYRYRLAHITPLPWCTRFSPHLDNIYTTLQLLASDGFDGRTGHAPITLEQILLEEKQNGELSLLNGGRPYRVLIEGNPGYGKTTLTLKMASDWAARKEYIDKFHLVFLIPLRDFQGDLQGYIFREFFPQHEDQGRDDWWHYVKENQQNVLFILDGLDELQPEHRAPIDMLLKGNLLDKVSVVVTSRSVPSDDHVLSFFNRRIEIRGFSQDQTEQFIQNYFQVKQKPEQSSKLTSLLNGQRWCGRHLTSCPLTCLFLCVVFEDEGDEGILHKVTKIYQGLISWLVRRVTKSGSVQISPDSTPIPAREYERALSDFGLLCLEALSRGKTQFTDEQLMEMPGNSERLLLDLGLLIRSNAPRTTTSCIPPKNLYYQPIHKTFLEYLAALYLSGSVEERLLRHFDCFQSDTLTRESLNLIFKFLAGLLAENAANLFRFRYLSAFELPMITLFELLHESGATPENVRALSSILDDEVVTVRSNRIELDGWAGLLAEPDCPIRSLKFIWADTPLNNAALDRFFTAFQTNRSVVCLIIMSASGLAPDENDVVAMGAFTVQALKKTQLRHFSLNLSGDSWAVQVVTAINSMLNYRYAASSLTSMKINVDLGTQQVVALSQGLRQSNVKSLVLSKLSCGPEGYEPIALLLKSLQHLSVSLNLIKTLPPTGTENVFEEGSPEDLQTFENYFNEAAQQRAGINTKIRTPPAENELMPNSKAFKSAASLISVLISENQTAENCDFNLKEGLYLPGCVAPNAVGLLKLSESKCPRNGNHSSGFHALFLALQEPDCQLSRLDLTGCCLGSMDLNCLGEALRNSRSLKSLRLSKMKSFEEVLPILNNTNLAWLDLSSGFISISDESIVALLLALSTATKLVALSLAGWKFTIKNPKIVSVFDRFLKDSRLQELNLTGCRFQFGPSFNIPSSRISSSRNSCLTGSQFLKVPTIQSYKSSNESVASQNSSLDSDEAFPFDNKDKEPWSNLVKLSLTETVASFQVAEEKNEEIITGPELLIHLDRLRNLSELSVSIRPSTSGSSAQFLDDRSTKAFFDILQRRNGKLEKLRLSFCSFLWHRPSQTSASLVRRLQKCEKLVSLELNFVQFRTGIEVEEETPTHYLLDAIVSGCVNLEELSLIGMSLTPVQAYHLGLQIRNKWKGQSVQIHTWCCGGAKNDEQRTEEVVSNLLHVLKGHPKFVTDYVGGYRGTILVRRRKLRCGLFRNIRISHLLPLFGSQSIRNQQEAEENGFDLNEVEELCSSLPPGQRSLFGLTPFDYSIMLAHTWDSNKF